MEQQILDEFEEYWTLLPVKDSEVYFEICNYLRNPGGETSATRVLKKSTIAYLSQNLLNFPYPVCQLLRCFPSSINGQIVYETLLRFVRNPELISQRKWKLLNLLANVQLGDKWMEKYEANVLPAIFQAANEHLILNEIALALLSNPSQRMLRSYMDFEVQHLCSSQCMFTHKTAYLMALHRKTHFLEPVIANLARDGIPSNVQDCFHLLRTIQLVNNGFPKSKENFQIVFSNFVDQIASDLLQPHQRIFYNELHRIFTLYDFLHANASVSSRATTPISSFATKYSVIDFLFKHIDAGCFLAKLDYVNVRDLLWQNECFNRMVNEALRHTTEESSGELDLYQQYYVAKTMAENMLLNPNSSNYIKLINGNCARMRDILDDMRHPMAYVEALETVYAMLFYRWEHAAGHVGVRADGGSSSLTTIQESDTSEDYTDDSVFLAPRKMQQPNVGNEKSGFMCNIPVLQAVLEMLNASTMVHKLSSDFQQTIDGALRPRLDTICSRIEDARWRLSLFELDAVSRESIQLSSDLKSMLTSVHGSMLERTTSSDEDDDEHGKSAASAGVTRRRPRRRVPFRRHEDKNYSFVHSTENEKTSNDANRANGFADKRSIISRMLGPAINLVAVCMSHGNMAEAKKIIEDNQLESTDLAIEWTFLDNFNRTKSQLNEHFCKYANENASDSLSDASTSVERIKQIAAHGFEASQISNLVETFIAKNRIAQSADVQKLLDKFTNHYPFLELYKQDALQGTIVTDYVLSLASNYDICFNIFNMLPKLWTRKFPIDKLDNQMGYFGCLKHILASVNLYNNQMKQNHGVQYVMSNECHTFNPNELALKLKQLETFLHLEQLGVEVYKSVDILKSNIKHFDVFNKKYGNLLNYIYSYIMNMNRLLSLRGISLTSPEQILATDLFSLIGIIIFEAESTVLLGDIEGLVSNLNTNILHVITKNTCPDIEMSKRFVDAPETMLDRLLTNLNNSNVDGEDEHRITDRRVFQLHRTDILNYVAKRNALVAFLVGQIHGLKLSADDEEVILDFNAGFLKNLLAMQETDVKMELYDDNAVVAALNLDYFDVINLERVIKTGKYDVALQVIHLAKEIDLRRHRPNLSNLKNILIIGLLQDCSSEILMPKYQLIEHIDDLNVRARVLLTHINKITSHQLANRLIRSILLHANVNTVSDETRMVLEARLANIRVYSEVAAIMSVDYANFNWFEMMERSKQAPETILHLLIDRSEYQLCLRWTRIHPLQGHQVTNPKFIECLTRALIEEKSRNADLFDFIESLPSEIVMGLDSTVLLKSKNRPLLEYLVNYLTMQKVNDSASYQHYEIALRIIDAVPATDVDSLWVLIGKPLLIIEQYIMNARFDSIGRIMKAIRPLIKGQPACKQCAERKDLLPKNNSDPNFNIRLYCDNSSDFSMLNNDINHENHCISTTCVDALFRIYAAKSLDFRISEMNLTVDILSQSEILSLDSICGAFLMPREVPQRLQWVRDQDALYCMCCKRSRFTMLTRRHHCRRCGRVVCHVCSTKRMQIPNMYADVPVRVCIDCYRQTEMMNQTVETKVPSADSPVQLSSFPEIITRSADEDGWYFRFSGQTKHDNLLREEFCFEYAPSVALCLSILAFHSTGSECGNFLLFYCRKFEALLQPVHPGCANSEVDYALVTRILFCLSLAAKVRGGSPECVRIREYADIIKSVVNSGCEALIPMEPSNAISLRKLRDSLVVAEKWSLAIEISLKCGFPKMGVMAAWGLACLKAGCFETAREKFVHCLSATAIDEDMVPLTEVLTSADNLKKKRTPRLTNPMRLSKNQPLLHEIINLLQVTCHPINADLTHRATMIKHSHRSIASNKSRKKENIPMHEPAINILHTLSNLRQISQGKFMSNDVELPLPNVSATVTSATSAKALKNATPIDMDKLHANPRFYSECVYYLVSYGRHLDILNFLVRQKQIIKALNYIIMMQVSPEQFIQIVVMPYLRKGKLDAIVTAMIDIDETLIIWKNYIGQICHTLEKRNNWNSLYQVQLLLKDTVRASMTCVRFYTMKCSTYQELRNNAFHLMNAQKHLKSELELCQWEEISVKSKKPEENISLAMKMDSKSLNQHINTICRQMEAAKFLAKCEESGRETVKLLPKISMLECQRIPTLFGHTQDKVLLTSLILISGSNIEEGFGLAYRIIQDLSLAADKIYSITTKYLSLNNRLQDVEKLIDCIKSNSARQEASICDSLLELSIQTALGVHGAHGILQFKSTLDNLIRLIGDVAMQIDCHIIAGQLKAAYLLAVANRRPHDIKRIARLAEKANQPHIKKLCEKKLGNIDDEN